MLIDSVNRYLQEAVFTPRQTDEERESFQTALNWFKGAAAVTAFTAPVFAYFFPMIFSIIAVATLFPVLCDVYVISNNIETEQSAQGQVQVEQNAETTTTVADRILAGTLFTRPLMSMLDRVHSHARADRGAVMAPSPRMENARAERGAVMAPSPRMEAVAVAP
jgi:hypothetical protein